MPRKKANTIAGKNTASDIEPFIKANIDDMKNSSSKRDAEKNEEIYIEDIANAIAEAARKMTDKRGIVDAAKALINPNLISSLTALGPTTPLTGPVLAGILQTVFTPISKLEEYKTL